jgi:5-hydroxyisourate hydrolase-like protein (transthyretin family)
VSKPPKLPKPPVFLPAQAALHAAILLLFGLAMAAALPAQTPAPSGPVASVAAGAKLYRIAGTVTNAVTGEPVARATVSLQDDTTRETISVTETNAEGQFQLPPVPAGKYPLYVVRRGYLPAYFDEHDQFSSAIVTGEGQETEQIPFRLSPGAMVHGVVSDDSGEPVEGARVQVFRKSRAGGLGERNAAGISGVTDDLGGYEFWNLMPGTYFLAVQAKPWFGVHRSLLRNQQQSQAQNNAAAALDVAYPVTYYDGATEEDAATPIALSSGDRAELNVALHAVPALHLMVHGADSGNSTHGYTPPPQLKQSILGQEAMASNAGVRQGPPGSGMVELFGVAPGHYTVTQGNPPRSVALDASGSGGVEVDPTQGTPAASVTVKLRMAGDAPLPQPLQLWLLAANGQQRVMPVSAVADGPGRANATFAAVAPGNWTLLAQSGNLALAVVSIQTAKAARQDSRFQVEDRPLSLSVVLIQGITQVTGFARKDGKGLPGVMVVLVPRDPAANLALFRRDQSDSDGSFSLPNVAPGRYTVVAIEDGWEMDWARPEVIARYLSQGIAVTVTESSGKLLRLSAAVPVESR